MPRGGEEPEFVLGRGHKRLLAALATFEVGQASTKDWIQATATDDDPPMAERTFHDRRNELVEKGYVGEVKRGGYKLTELGSATAKTLQLFCNRRVPIDPAATAPTP
jgi:hypothetical protein